MSSDIIDVEILREIGRIANSDIHIDERLKVIISVIIEKTGADASSILLLDQHDNNLIFKATQGLNPDLINKIRIPVDKGIVGYVVRNKEIVALSVAADDPRFEPVPGIGEERFKSVLAVPILHKGLAIGLIYNQTVAEKTYTKREIELLEVIAEQVTGVIRNSQLYEKTCQHLSSLLSLNYFNERVNSSTNTGDLLNDLAGESLKMVKGDASVVWIVAEDKLVPMAHAGGDIGGPVIYEPIKIGEGLIGKVAEERKGLIVNSPDVWGEDMFVRAASPKAVIVVPLLVGKKVVGVLAVADKVGAERGDYIGFEPEELEILSSLSVYAAMAINRLDIYKKLERVSAEREKKIKELAILHEIGVAIQTVPDFNTLIRLILGCITVGDGLGFNRAMLFLVNDETNMLEGTMGLGPDSMDEAVDIWRSMPKIDNLVKWLLTHDYKDQGTGTHLNNLVKNIRVPIDSSGGILPMTLIKGKSFNVPDASQHPYIDRDFIEKIGTNSFAVVPIIVREQHIGVILVDNCYTEKEITEGDIEYLVHFTSYIGLAIHNRRLFKKLRESHNDILVIQNKLLRSEKLSALGELTAELVHELKNPLMVIGGLTRRIISNPNIDPDKYDRYNRAIQDEVSRIEKLLKEIQTNSRLVTTELAETDINMLIEDIIFFYEHTSRDRMVDIVKELSNDVGRCLIDADRFKQVIINLVHNSMDAMPGGGTLTIKTEPVKDDYNNGIMLTVMDTGTGIPPNVIDRIFDPFFTTKDDGTGLGLAMSKKIVEAHGGTIDYRGRPGGGAIFTIYIPKVGEGSMLVQANISSKKVRHH
ncbi:MAG: GAF domain-containing protein [Nitrospinota bacterium]|nr:GAF domain-containing protein [Nitrospinota bacterium]